MIMSSETAANAFSRDNNSRSKITYTPFPCPFSVLTI